MRKEIIGNCELYPQTFETAQPLAKATMKSGDEFRMDGANLILCTQADLCDAEYALYLAGEDEKDPEKKAALERVGNALHAITNHFGVDGIGNFDLLREYGVVK